MDLFIQARFRFVDFEQARDRDGADGFSVGRLVPTVLCAHLCGLGIHASRLLDRETETSRSLAKLCLGVAGFETKGDSEPHPHAFDRVLNRTLERNAYPIYGRLHGLKILADDRILSGELAPGSELKAVLVSRLEELEETADAFDAPMHFTAFHFGVTRALDALSRSSDVNIFSREQRAKLLSAIETLKSSIGMYSMQKVFYRTIDQLYYLYDDFNDRRVHSCHAQQMAGAELTHLLIELLEGRLHAPEGVEGTIP